MKISYFEYTDKGGRKENEDACTVAFESPKRGLLARLAGRRKEPEYVLAAAADGLGGHGSGDVASGQVIKSLKEELAGAYASGKDASQEVIDTSWLFHAFEHINQTLLRMQEKTGTRMKTTGSAVILSSGKALLASTGDTRIYHLQRDKVVHVTADHSVSYSKFKAGEISYDDLRFDDDQNRLLKALGSEKRWEPDVKQEPLLPEGGDIFILCTDGAWKHFTHELLEEKARSTGDAKELGEALVSHIKTNLEPDNDNYTVVVLKR